MEVNAGIKLDAYSWEILYNVLHSHVSGRGLQMIGQSVVGPVEIVTFIFDPSAKVPFSSDQKPVIVAEVVVKRITIPKLRFVKIALEGVRRLV